MNIKRDPFETSIGGSRKKDAFWSGGALAAPATAYIYDWNLLPIGQLLWLKELETYMKFPPMQDPASYNLDQVMEQLKKEQGHPSPIVDRHLGLITTAGGSQKGRPLRFSK